MFLSFIYEVALIILGFASLPKTLYMLIVHKKYRSSLGQRFGKNFPPIKKNGRQLIWVHAVSVGETKAIAPLVKRLKATLANPIILISNTTETGHAEAQQSISCADHHVYLPFDFGWIIKPLIAKAVPDLVILSESDLWLNFLKTAKKNGAKIALVNGKISEKSMHRFARFPRFTQELLSHIDIFCVQNHQYSHRFEQLQVPPHKLAVTGNMKFDDDYMPLSEAQLEGWKQQLGIKSGDLVIVFGSSHEPEEKIILSLLGKLRKKFSSLKLVLVPRHPERFNEVAGILQKQNVPFHRFTRIHHASQEAKVILMDAMGLLRKCYQLADVAIVGGSYTTKVGGHNILEPCWYGIPVIYGPYMHSQRELVELMMMYQAGLQVSQGMLENCLENLLKSSEEREVMGKAGYRLVSEMHGATQKTLRHLQSLQSH